MMRFFALEGGNVRSLRELLLIKPVEKPLEHAVLHADEKQDLCCWYECYLPDVSVPRGSNAVSEITTNPSLSIRQ